MWPSSVHTDTTEGLNNVNSVTDSETKHTDMKTKDTQDVSNLKQQTTRRTSLSESETSKTRKDARNSSTFWQFGALVCCFYANFISGGLLSAFGVMYTYMQDSLGVSIFQLTWIGSLMAGFQGFTSLIATVLIDVFGCRVTVLIGALLGSCGVICSSLTSNILVLYFTLGMLPGVGCCLCYNASMVQVPKSFSRWRPLAVGLSVTGSAVGMLSYPPLTSLMIEHFGWKGSLLLHGAIYLHLLPAGLLIEHVSYKAKKQEEKLHTTTTIRQNVKNYLKIFQQVPVLLVALAHCFIGLANPTFTTFLPEYVTSGPLQLTQMDSALILSLAGIGNLFGRVVCGVVALVHLKAPQVMYPAALIIVGVTEVAVVLNRTGLQMMINSAIFGIANGAWPTVASLVFINLFGLENLSKTFGAFTFCQGIGSFCAPPLQSYLASLLNNQDITFYIGGGSFVMAFVIIVIVILSVTPFAWSRTSLEINPMREHIQNERNRSFTKTRSVNVGRCGIQNEAFEADKL